MNQPSRQHGFSAVVRAVRTSFILFYDHFGIFVLASLVWWLSAATLVMLGPATLVLYRLARLAAQGRRLEWREAWLDWRENYVWSSMHALGWLAIFVGILLNVRFYQTITQSILTFTIGFPITLIWIGIGLMLFPAALDYDSKRVRRSFGVASVEFGRSPLRALGMWLIGWLMLAICVILIPLFIFLPPVVALWTTLLLVPYEAIPPAK